MNYGILKNIKYIIKKTIKWDKNLLILFFINTIIISIKPLPTTILPKYIVEALTFSYENTYAVIITSVGLLLSSFILNVFSIYLSNRSWPRINHIRMKFMIMVGRKTMEIPYEKTEEPQILDLAEKTERAWECLDDGIAGVLNDIFSSMGKIISVILLGTILLSIDIFIFVFAIIICLMKFLLSKFFAKREDVLNDEVNPLNRKYDYWLNLLFDKNALKDILLYNYQKKVDKKISNTILQRMNKRHRVYNNTFFSSQVNSFLELVLNFFVYIVLIYLVLIKQITIADYILCISAVASLTGVLFSIFNTISHIYEQNISINTFRKYCEMSFAEDKHNSKENLEITKLNSIRFSNVSFSYPGNEKNALSNVSFEIKKGEKIGIVGTNGAGKSTIISLLLKFYTNYDGEIYINNINLKQIDSSTIRNLFSTVFQDIHLYAYTFRENIATDNFDKNKFFSVINKTDLEECVNKMPHRENTHMTKLFDDNGFELSGGEMQKVAIARALYKECDCVILDEPTAALDALSEYKLYQLVDDAFANKLVVFISHRLMSTRFCDKIFVLNNGIMVEQGNHEELMEKKGLYLNMFEKQSFYYIHEGNSKSENKT